MSTESHESRQESYRQKLKDPRWQKVRLKVFERDGFRCQFCGDNEETLHVHHLYYTRGCEPWDYLMDALTTVCETCHEDENRSRRESEERLLRVLRVTGFSARDLDCLADTIGTVHFSCAKREFVEFFNWMMEESQKEYLGDYFPCGLSGEWEKANDAQPWEPGHGAAISIHASGGPGR